MAGLACTLTTTRPISRRWGCRSRRSRLCRLRRELPNGPATLQSPFVPLVQPNSSYPIFVMRTPTSTPFIQGTDPNVLDGKTRGVQPERAVCPGERLSAGDRICGNAVGASTGADRIRSGATGQSRESGQRPDDELGQQCDRPHAHPGSKPGVSVHEFESSSRTTTRCRPVLQSGWRMGSSSREAMCGRRTSTR